MTPYFHDFDWPLANLPADKVVLHVGCGPPGPFNLHPIFRSPDWNEIRLDIDPKVKPDVVASIVNMVDVESNSVDAVWSSHNLEHLYPHEVPLALAEFHRVIKGTGFVLVAVPDLQVAAEMIASDKLVDPAFVSPAGPITPLDLVYGFRPSLASGNLYMAHHCGFTARFLSMNLLQTGLRKVKVERAHYSVWAPAQK